MKKKGSILTENVIFLVLNMTFFAIMILFLLKQGGGVFMEQAYAKQIALAIDSAKPGMEILVDISEGASSDKKWFATNFAKSVVISGNFVTVTLGNDGGYTYSFFNNVKPSIDVFPDGKVYIVVKNG